MLIFLPALLARLGRNSNINGWMIFIAFLKMREKKNRNSYCAEIIISHIKRSISMIRKEIRIRADSFRRSAHRWINFSRKVGLMRFVIFILNLITIAGGASDSQVFD